MSRCEVVLMMSVLAITSVAAAYDAYKLCVSKRHDEEPPNPSAFSHCQDTVQQLRPFGVNLECVSGGDSMDCLEKVARGEAHVSLVVHPEDLFLAGRHFPTQMVVLADVRNSIDAGKYRYEAIVLVRLSSGINSVEHLRGKKACLSSLHRVEEWAQDDFVLHLLTGKLLDLGVAKPICEDIPALERDLASVSQLFGPSCAPGQWFYGKKMVEHQLRVKYQSLTSLCKDPMTSSHQYDDYAGVDGALQCLLEVGDLAFTTAGAAISDSSLMEYSEEYGLLCPDGRVQPMDFLLNGTQCTWAAAPWPAFLASSSLVQSKQAELRRQISIIIAVRQGDSVLFNTVDELFTPEIAASVLVSQVPPPLVGYHMKASNYSSSIDRPRCPRDKHLRLCTRNVDEQGKCRAFKEAAKSRRIFPEISCIPGASSEDCLDKINRGKSDLISADSGLLHSSKGKQKLEAILSENPPGSDRNYYLVAVVRNDSGIRTLEDLWGKSACYISHAGNDYGWQYPVRILKDAGKIPDSACDLGGSLASVFSDVCVFGTHLEPEDTRWGNPDRLCGLCRSGTPDCPTKSSRTSVSEENVFRCLADKIGDIAFVTLHQGLREFNDYIDEDTRKVAIGLDFTSLSLLCPHGESSLQPLTSYYQCHWGTVPGRKVITRLSKSASEFKNYLYVLLEAAELFKRKTSPFWLFGPFQGNHDLIFHDNTKRFYHLPTSESMVAPVKDHEDISRYFKMIDRIPRCCNNSGFLWKATWIFPFMLTFLAVVL